MSNSIRVYIAGPLSQGDTLANIAHAITVANNLYDLGFTPFVPHTMMAMWHMRYPKSHNAWVAFDLEWLDKCDVVFRIPGESAGADAECLHAALHGIPITGSIKALQALFPDVRPRPEG